MLSTKELSAEKVAGAKHRPDCFRFQEQYREIACKALSSNSAALTGTVALSLDPKPLTVNLELRLSFTALCWLMRVFKKIKELKLF